MLNDCRIRVHQDLTDHESQDLLAVVHGRVTSGIAQPCEKTLLDAAGLGEEAAELPGERVGLREAAGAYVELQLESQSLAA
jgi:hypothetical protein